MKANRARIFKNLGSIETSGVTSANALVGVIENDCVLIDMSDRSSRHEMYVIAGKDDDGHMPSRRIFEYVGDLSNDLNPDMEKEEMLESIDDTAIALNSPERMSYIIAKPR